MPRPSLYLLDAFAIVPACGLAQTGTAPSEQPKMSGTASVQYASYDSKTNRVVLRLAFAPHDRNLQLLARTVAGRSLGVTITMPKPHDGDPAYNGVFDATLLAGGREIAYSPKTAPRSGAFATGGMVTYAAKPVTTAKREPTANKSAKGLRDCPSCTGTLSFVQDIGDDLEAPTSWVLDSSGFELAVNSIIYDPSVTLSSRTGFTRFSTEMDSQGGIAFSWEGDLTDMDFSPGIYFNENGFVNEATGTDENAVTGTLTLDQAFNGTPCTIGAVIWDYDGMGDVGCDNAFVYAPASLPGYTPNNNLSMWALEGLNFADAPYALGSYPNSLEYLFGTITQGTVVANPLYANTNTIGSFSSPYGIRGTSMPDMSNQVDMRYGHFGQISHNWKADAFTGTPSASNLVCLGDKNLSDPGGVVTNKGFFFCSNLLLYSAVPGWNAWDVGGDTLVTVDEKLIHNVWSSGIKSALSVGIYSGGIGDSSIIDSDGIWKPGFAGASDEGIEFIRLNESEAVTYTGTVANYAAVPNCTSDCAATAGNVLIVVPCNATPCPTQPNQNQEVGVGHPMLDTSASFASTGINTINCNLCTLTDRGTASWTPSISAQVGSSGITPTIERLPNSGLGTLATIPLANMTGKLQMNDMVGLCGGGSMTFDTCNLTYEKVRVNAIVTDYDPSAQTETINAYIRFSHPVGSPVNGGGLVGSYISFDDYTGGSANTGQVYVQNVFSNTANTLTFGILAQGSLVSYYETLPVSASTFPYHLWRGGTVYDVRDPNPSITTCAGAMVDSADGCYFIIEDSSLSFPNSTPFPTGTPAPNVAQTNYAAQNWTMLSSGTDIIDPYAHIVGIGLNVPGGTGGGYFGSTVLQANGVGAGFHPMDLTNVLGSQRNLSLAGVYGGPTLINAAGYFGEGIYMYGTPYGSGSNRPTFLEINTWTPCSSTPNLRYCSIASDTNYYQSYFHLLEMNPSAAGTQQEVDVYRDGTFRFANQGTMFAGYGSGPAVTVTGGAQTDTLTCTSSPCGTFKGATSAIGGSALAAGACAAGTATIAGATTTMVATASPASDPQGGSLTNGLSVYAYVSAANIVTVRACALVPLTPVSTVYNVRVEP